jgi:hypothetical protein
MERGARFALFVEEMEAAEPAASYEEARQLLETILNEVENRHSGVPFIPDNCAADGRMYPPQDDSEQKSGLAGVRMFRTRRHRVWIAENGAIRITTAGTRGEQIVLDKAGKDGGAGPAG